MIFVFIGIGGLALLALGAVASQRQSADSGELEFDSSLFDLNFVESELPDFAEAAISNLDEPMLTFEPTSEIALESVKSGNSYLDRAEILLPVYNYARLNHVDPRVCLGLVRKESASGNPKYFLGDGSANVGPSIGAMQCSRALAKEMGMWIPPAGLTNDEERAEFAKLHTDIDFGIRLGCAAFANKLRAANGDYVDAIRRYNGSGPKARAYRDDVVNWLNSTFGA